MFATVITKESHIDGRYVYYVKFPDGTVEPSLDEETAEATKREYNDFVTYSLKIGGYAE
jgi:hypothetical protein